MACKVTCYFRLFSSVLVSVPRTSINVLSKSKSRNYVTWIANLTKLFLSVDASNQGMLSNSYTLLVWLLSAQIQYLNVQPLVDARKCVGYTKVLCTRIVCQNFAFHSLKLRNAGLCRVALYMVHFKLD